MLQLEPQAVGDDRGEKPDSAASEFPPIVALIVTLIVAGEHEEDPPGREKILRLGKNGAVTALLGRKSRGTTAEVFGEEFFGDRLVDPGLPPLQHRISLRQRPW